jgi:hypothetical protein
MTKLEKGTRNRHSRSFWGAHAPSRAPFGALAETLAPPIGTARGKAPDHEGVIASTLGACAPL